LLLPGLPQAWIAAATVLAPAPTRARMVLAAFDQQIADFRQKDCSDFSDAAARGRICCGHTIAMEFIARHGN